MPRKPDSGEFDLVQGFHRVQKEMLAQLSVGGMFEYTHAAGNASEQRWLDLFERYLPRRYRAASAFVIDSRGHRSRQIDLAVFDNLYSPLLFPHKSGLHVPAESVYAVFEIKQIFNRTHIVQAAQKAASVRALNRTSVPVIAGGFGPARRRRPAIAPQPILAGLLATASDWTRDRFEESLVMGLADFTPGGRLDLGCSLQHGAFENCARGVRISDPEESLIFFMVRLLERLRAMGTAPAPDLMKYAHAVRSLWRKLA